MYNINYHLVFCPKYRKKVLVESVKTIVEDTIKEACNQRGWELIEQSVEPDHVHIFVSVPPIFSPMFVVKVLKGMTAIRAIKEHRWAERFWSPSYYVGTAGTVTEKTIKRYVQEQESRR